MDVTKIPPHNLEAEASVLGALILDNGAMEKIVGFLSPDDFYHTSNKKLFDEIRFLIKEGEPADPTTLCDNITAFPNSKIAPHDYILDLIDLVPTTANIEYYAKIVKAGRHPSKHHRTCRERRFRSGAAVGTTHERAVRPAAEQAPGYLFLPHRSDRPADRPGHS